MVYQQGDPTWGVGEMGRGRRGGGRTVPILKMVGDVLLVRLVKVVGELSLAVCLARKERRGLKMART